MVISPLCKLYLFKQLCFKRLFVQVVLILGHHLKGPIMKTQLESKSVIIPSRPEKYSSSLLDLDAGAVTVTSPEKITSIPSDKRSSVNYPVP